MSFEIKEYETLVFDCDGVVLDSNRVKTEAFYQATLPYGEAAAQAMVDYHVANGGVSRYKKFAHFLAQIAPAHAAEQQGPDLKALLHAFASHVRQGMLNCEMAPGLEALRQRTPNARWLIVSGGDQDELRDVFARRGIAKWFDGGIFGSPDTKEAILQRELTSGNMQRPALFLGDSKYDYHVANEFELGFLFVSGWSEFEDWQHWVDEMRLEHVSCVKDVIENPIPCLIDITISK